MKKIKYYLILLLLTACANNSSLDMEVLSGIREVDLSSPDSSVCSTFELSNTEILIYFSVAKKTKLTEFQHRSLILPCKYSGIIKVKGELLKYEIYAGGSGVLYDTAGWQAQTFICDDAQCCSKFKNLC